MTQRIINSPRKRDHEDIHLQSCGALSSSSSPSMCHSKHQPQKTSSTTDPQGSPSSEQDLECRETVLWPLGLRLWGHSGVLMFLPCAADFWRVINISPDVTASLFAQCGCSTRHLKCSHTASSAQWDNAKSSANMVANSVEPASVCSGFYHIRSNKRMFFSLRGPFLLNFSSF